VALGLLPWLPKKLAAWIVVEGVLIPESGEFSSSLGSINLWWVLSGGLGVQRGGLMARTGGARDEEELSEG
jgi:hypothetical protein